MQELERFEQEFDARLARSLQVFFTWVIMATPFFTARLFLHGFHFFLYLGRPKNQPSMVDIGVCFTDTMMIIEDRLIRKCIVLHVI